MAKGQFPAKYETGREKDGKFSPGNKLGIGNNCTQLARFKELRALFYSVLTDDMMLKLTEELCDMALNCDKPDTKLKALVYLQDRVHGKVTEHVQIDNIGGPTSANQFNFNLLSEAEVEALRPMLPKLLARPDLADPMDLPEFPTSEDVNATT